MLIGPQLRFRASSLARDVQPCIHHTAFRPLKHLHFAGTWAGSRCSLKTCSTRSASGRRQGNLQIILCRRYVWHCTCLPWPCPLHWQYLQAAVCMPAAADVRRCSSHAVSCLGMPAVLPPARQIAQPQHTPTCQCPHHPCCLQLSAALNMMNSSVDGGPPPSSWTAPQPPQPAAGAYGAAPVPPAAAPVPHYDASDLTLRQVRGCWCWCCCCAGACAAICAQPGTTPCYSLMSCRLRRCNA